MIEQALSRKDLTGVHRDEIEQPLEPARGQRPMLALHARTNEVAEVRDDHERRREITDGIIGGERRVYRPKDVSPSSSGVLLVIGR